MTRREDPAYWRKRAEEARTVADMMNRLEDRRLLLEVANGYDRLAGYAELLVARIRSVSMREPRTEGLGNLVKRRQAS